MSARPPGRHAARTTPVVARDAPPAPARAPHGPPPWWLHLREHLQAPWIWVVLWLVSRAWLLHLNITKYSFIRSDVNYYLWWLSAGKPIRETLVEYPLPVVWFLDAVRVLSSDQSTYLLAFGCSMALLDLVFAWALWRRRALRALLFWMGFVTFFGSLIWVRYDMLPAFAVGMAALVVSRHPRAAGALVALGAGLKLWPALLIAPLLGRSRAAMLRTIWFGITGAALALAAYLHGGWDRLTSPLTWQSDRGLQVESVPATWLMWQRATADVNSWRVEMSKYNAFEIFGPGIEGWMQASDVVMVLAIGSAVGMTLMVFIRRQLPADLLVLAMTSIVLAMLVANKTLSPQYLLWLATPVAALLAVATTPVMRRRAVVLAGATLVAGYLTQQIYPGFYGHIIGATPQVSATLLLVARNLLLVAMMVVTTVWTWADLTDTTGSKVGTEAANR